MNDLEITKLCAEASEVWKDAHKRYPTMTLDSTFSGLTITDTAVYLKPNNPFRQDPQLYDPLHDDAQAMALVKKMKLELKCVIDHWHAWDQYGAQGATLCKDLNRAICECVAKMQAAKGKP